MSIFMTLVIVIFMIFFDTLVEIKQFKKSREANFFFRKSLKQNIKICPIVSSTNQVYGDKTNRLKKLEIEVLSLFLYPRVRKTPLNDHSISSY